MASSFFTYPKETYLGSCSKPAAPETVGETAAVAPTPVATTCGPDDEDTTLAITLDPPAPSGFIPENKISLFHFTLHIEVTLGVLWRARI